MDQQDTLQQVLEAGDKRRAERREFFRYAGGFGIAAAGAAVLSACGGNDDDDGGTVSPTATPTPSPTGSATSTPTPTPTATEADVLNFALNLEYLEAQFYAYAANGTGLPASMLGGAGTAGEATGARQVAFTDPLVARYAREIAADEQAHVAFLRRTIGTTAIAQPAIDLSTAATGAFSAAAVAAKLIKQGETFDPYASDENFLLAAFLFEDVGVTAYRGAIGFLSTTAYIDGTAGIQASEAYHAGLIRTVLYRKGVDAAALIEATETISDARDGLDGAGDADQGVKIQNGASNIVPSDGTGLAYGRTPQQVLNIVYLNRESKTSGGFFPQGVNGFLKTSGAN
ncbi:ferritin-like domain-containing protein [Sphingomonas sp. ac-8]|uniref:ferritin-like domain-containing protein n=1 Tax=Sphingomonas sp. ac-8 TaxID=3242977 RepID=UPI003A802A71